MTNESPPYGRLDSMIAGWLSPIQLVKRAQILTNTRVQKYLHSLKKDNAPPSHCKQLVSEKRVLMCDECMIHISEGSEQY